MPPDNWTDLWAIACYNFRLDWEEFAECTPKMYRALFNRYHIGIRHLRYANALTTAAVYNSNRSKADDPIVEAFAFVATEEEAARKARRKPFREYVNKALSMWVQLPAKFAEKRLLVIQDLRVAGCENPEELVARMFPEFKPKED